MNSNQVARILVDLDALLDTRLGTMHLIDPDKAKALVVDDRYYLRLKDDFSDIVGVDAATFAEHYAKRDVSTLQHSVVTNIAFVLAELVHKLEVRRSEIPNAPKPMVQLNIWPYQLNDHEREMMTNAVLCFSGIETRVDVVTIPPERLTMTMLRKSYAMVIMYDYVTWTRLHMTEMQSVQAPTVTLFVPALAAGDIPTSEQLEDMGINGRVDPFRLMEIAFAETIGLDAMPAYQFSIHRPDKMTEWGDRYYKELPQSNSVEWRAADKYV